MFSSKLEDGMIDTVDLGDTTIEVVMEDSTQDKFNKLDIDAELQLSVLSGLVKLKGSGSYLADERKSARAQRMSLIYKVSTVNEEMMIRHNKEKIDKDILSSFT